MLAFPVPCAAEPGPTRAIFPVPAVVSGTVSEFAGTAGLPETNQVRKRAFFAA